MCSWIAAGCTCVLTSRVELLSFAVTHCEPVMIEPIFRAKCLLQAQINHEILHTELAGRGAEGGRGAEEGHGTDRGRVSLIPPPSSAMNASGAIQQTKAILSSSKKVRYVHVSMLNSNWSCIFHIIQ